MGYDGSDSHGAILRVAPFCVNSDGSEAILGHVGKDNILEMGVQQDRGSCNLDTVELPDSFQRGCYVRNSYFGFGL